MPRPHPPEFRQRAVELARLREQPMAKTAADLGMPPHAGGAPASPACAAGCRSPMPTRAAPRA